MRCFFMGMCNFFSIKIVNLSIRIWCLCNDTVNGKHFRYLVLLKHRYAEKTPTAIIFVQTLSSAARKELETNNHLTCWRGVQTLFLMSYLFLCLGCFYVINKICINMRLDLKSNPTFFVASLLICRVNKIKIS